MVTAEVVFYENVGTVKLVTTQGRRMRCATPTTNNTAPGDSETVDGYDLQHPALFTLVF